MTGPSDKAVEAAQDRLRGTNAFGSREPGYTTRMVVEALHDPALGLDRSVCLRDVVEALRGTSGGRRGTTGWYAAAGYIEKRFGGTT